MGGEGALHILDDADPRGYIEPIDGACRAPTGLPPGRTANSARGASRADARASRLSATRSAPGRARETRGVDAGHNQAGIGATDEDAGGAGKGVSGGHSVLLRLVSLSSEASDEEDEGGGKGPGDGTGAWEHAPPAAGGRLPQPNPVGERRGPRSPAERRSRCHEGGVPRNGDAPSQRATGSRAAKQEGGGGGVGTRESPRPSRAASGRKGEDSTAAGAGTAPGMQSSGVETRSDGPRGASPRTRWAASADTGRSLGTTRSRHICPKRPPPGAQELLFGIPGSHAKALGSPACTVARDPGPERGTHRVEASAGCGPLCATPVSWKPSRIMIFRPADMRALLASTRSG